MYRYWNGTTWSASVTPNPQSPPPPGAIGTPPTEPLGQRAPYQQPSKRRTPIGWWIGIGVAVIVVGLVAWLVIRGVAGVFGGGNNPGSNPTGDYCPKQNPTAAQPTTSYNDGRVHGGKLSYPQLGAPFGAPSTDLRVPFGRDVQVQTAPDQDNYDGKGSSWVASVLVAELAAGDGFFSPQQGSEIVVRCVVGEFYGGAKVNRDDQVNKEIKVDGKSGWLVESHLTFDIKGLNAKGELLILAIVQTSAESSSLFYASIPDTKPELVQPARNALANLKVHA